MKNLLEIKNLTKTYDGFALQDFNLEIAPGETVGLVGTNGAGKTTLIKTILGHVRATSGTIALFGQETKNGATAQMKEEIGVVFDTCMFQKNYSVKNIVTLMSFSYANWDKEAFKYYFERLGISSFKKVEELSRGNSMKLAIACALAAKPKLLLLDEATAGLDPMVRDEVLETLRQYQLESDCGMLMCSHITSDLEKVADRIVCLDNGKTVFTCESEAIIDMAGLARCRSVDVDALLEVGYFQPGQMKLEQSKFGINVLVENRYDFMKQFPEIPCDHCSIEDYMRICLKGETR